MKESSEERFTASRVVSKLPLIGTVGKILDLKACEMASITEAIKLGKYDGFDHEIVYRFAENEVSLVKPARVLLVRFNRDICFGELAMWSTANGCKQPILSKHLYTIGIQYGEEQRKSPIVAPGSARTDRVLCLDGDIHERNLVHRSVGGSWNRFWLFGFLA